MEQQLLDKVINELIYTNRECTTDFLKRGWIRY